MPTLTFLTIWQNYVSWLCAGKAAQQINVPVPEGCTDPNAENFDPTARSDDGTCLYTVWELEHSPLEEKLGHKIIE